MNVGNGRKLIHSLREMKFKMSNKANIEQNRNKIVNPIASSSFPNGIFCVKVESARSCSKNTYSNTQITLNIATSSHLRKRRDIYTLSPPKLARFRNRMAYLILIFQLTMDFFHNL